MTTETASSEPAPSEQALSELSELAPSEQALSVLSEQTLAGQVLSGQGWWRDALRAMAGR